MPRYDWTTPGPYCFMDIETQSAADLRKIGGKAYINDPSTRLLSVVFMVDDRLIVWIPDGRTPLGYGYTAPSVELHIGGMPDIIAKLAETHVWVAHNAETFDAVAWERFYPDVRPRWIDTLHFCRLYGYPGSLDAASKAMGGAGKSDTTAMKLLTTAKVVSGQVRYPVGTKPLWDQLIAYNIADVVELKRISDEVLYNDRYRENPTLEVSSEVNQRGMYVDLPFARTLRDCWDTLRQQSYDHIAEMTGGKLTADNIRSPKQVKAWLESVGFPMVSLNSATVNQILNDPEKYINEADCERTEAELAIALLAERQNATRSTVGKLDRLFAVVDPDSCVRNIIQYHGAGTGRYSGRDLQPHNFARGVLDGATVAELLSDMSWERVQAVAAKTKHPTLKNRNVSVSDVLATLTRSVLRARPGKKIIPIDFMGVEARGTAWVARCDRMLNVFSDKSKDIYCDMASSLYQREVTKHNKEERQCGKIIVLGCGYGMGHAKFDVTARVLLVDLAAANVTAEQCVKAYREAYPEIPAVWRAYDKAMHYVVQNPGQTVVAGRCTFGYSGGFAWIELPSGRRLRYRNARRVLEAPKWDPNGRPMWQICYDTPYGFRKYLYGGLICENIVQAICRDILTDRMVALREHCPVLHVHDEIVFEEGEERASDVIHTIGKQMATPPEWAADFPLGCEGFTGTHYTKAELPGEVSVKYLSS